MHAEQLVLLLMLVIPGEFLYFHPVSASSNIEITIPLTALMTINF